MNTPTRTNNQNVPISDEPVADVDTDLRRQRQSFAHAAIELGKYRNDEDHQDRDDDDRHADDRARIDHRAFDLFLKAVGLFDEQRDAVKNCV